jgi:hypothetical protein
MKLKTAGGMLALIIVVALVWMAHNADGMAFLKRLHGG